MLQATPKPKGRGKKAKKFTFTEYQLGGEENRGRPAKYGDHDTKETRQKRFPGSWSKKLNTAEAPLQLTAPPTGHPDGEAASGTEPETEVPEQ